MDIVVSKEVVDAIIRLGVPYNSTIEKVGLQKAASVTLSEYEKENWNGAWSKFIEKNYSYIEAIATAKDIGNIKYKFATIYKDAITGAMEIEECK